MFTPLGMHAFCSECTNFFLKHIFSSFGHQEVYIVGLGYKVNWGTDFEHLCQGTHNMTLDDPEWYFFTFCV